MTTTTHPFAEFTTPIELEAKQSEARKLARQLLKPAHLAELLLDRARDDLNYALCALLGAADESRLMQIEREELDADKLEQAILADARRAVDAMLEFFDIETVRRLIDEHEDMPPPAIIKQAN